MDQPKGRNFQVHKDRVIVGFSTAYSKEARIDDKYDFDPRVKQACLSDRGSTAGLKICKMIVVGDTGVGKTCLVNRFCKQSFDKDYKATIGVDFEVERFEILNQPFTLQIWDTAGQERFQCIAAAYYRGAHVVVVVFDVSDIETLRSAQGWLEAAQKENKQSNTLLVFLVGSKRDLLNTSAYEDVEKEAIKTAQEMNAEYWSVSSKTGERVKEFFFRVSALSFERSVMQEFEKRHVAAKQMGDGKSFQINSKPQSTQNASHKRPCCKN